jgi:exonuclease SbcD
MAKFISAGKPLKILHTSDWHLGRSLYDRKRYDEFGKFLEWLTAFLKTEKIDIVLIAGDIFDTTTPGNRAQELYYQFLTRASKSGCRHIVITGGNHDSPTFLNAPKELLRFFNVYVIGAMTTNPVEEVITLYDNSSLPEAIICAVPYLRDKDIRTVEAGENMEDKNRKLLEGIDSHYQTVGALALEKRNGTGNIPIIGMGHLFTAGGNVTEGDGVRELYVGGEARVSGTIFPEYFDYLALGHLHTAQKVGNSWNKRYCGSPIAMGFGEAGQEKRVIVVEFGNSAPVITEHTVPCFQELIRVTGNSSEIISKIERLKTFRSNAWLEINFTGPENFTGLSDLTYEAISGTGMEILRIKIKRITSHALSHIEEQETLDDLDERDVFNRCLDSHQIEDHDRGELINTYEEIIRTHGENDSNAL